MLFNGLKTQLDQRVNAEVVNTKITVGDESFRSMLKSDLHAKSTLRFQEIFDDAKGVLDRDVALHVLKIQHDKNKAAFAEVINDRFAKLPVPATAEQQAKQNQEKEALIAAVNAELDSINSKMQRFIHSKFDRLALIEVRDKAFGERGYQDASARSKEVRTEHLKPQTIALQDNIYGKTFVYDCGKTIIFDPANPRSCQSAVRQAAAKGWKTFVVTISGVSSELNTMDRNHVRKQALELVLLGIRSVPPINVVVKDKAGMTFEANNDSSHWSASEQQIIDKAKSEVAQNAQERLDEFKAQYMNPDGTYKAETDETRGQLQQIFSDFSEQVDEAAKAAPAGADAAAPGPEPSAPPAPGARAGAA